MAGAAGVILLVAVVAAVVVIISRCLILQGLSVILMFILINTSEFCLHAYIQLRKLKQVLR